MFYSDYDKWKLATPWDDEDENSFYEENLKLEFEGTEENLNNFQNELEEKIKEWANEHNVKVIFL